MKEKYACLSKPPISITTQKGPSQNNFNGIYLPYSLAVAVPPPTQCYTAEPDVIKGRAKK